MLRRIAYALLCEIIALVIVIISVLFITTQGPDASLTLLTWVGLCALTLWSGLTVFAILLGADLIGP